MCYNAEALVTQSEINVYKLYTHKRYRSLEVFKCLTNVCGSVQPFDPGSNT